MCVCKYACTTVRVWKMESNVQDLLFSIYYVSSKDQIQVVN